MQIKCQWKMKKERNLSNEWNVDSALFPTDILITLISKSDLKCLVNLVGLQQILMW